MTVGIGVLALGVIGLAANLAISRTKSKSDPPLRVVDKPKPERVAAELPDCGDKATKATSPTDNPDARAAAQRGLDFLGREASAWTRL